MMVICTQPVCSLLTRFIVIDKSYKGFLKMVICSFVFATIVVGACDFLVMVICV